MEKVTEKRPTCKKVVSITALIIAILFLVFSCILLYILWGFARDTCPYHDDYNDAASFAYALNERVSPRQKEDFIIVLPKKEIVEKELYYIWLRNSYEGCSYSKQINVTHLYEEFSFLPNEIDATKMMFESSEELFEPIGTLLGSYVFNGLACSFYDNEYLNEFVCECYFTVGVYSYKLCLETESPKPLAEISLFVGDMISNRMNLDDFIFSTSATITSTYALNVEEPYTDLQKHVATTKDPYNERVYKNEVSEYGKRIDNYSILYNMTMFPKHDGQNGCGSSALFYGRTWNA